MSVHRWDIVIRGARIFDGTGTPPFVGDLAVRGDRIAAVGEVEGAAVLERGAVIEIDARGLALAPGFIDVHSHDDFAVLTTPAMDFKLMQGVTTEVVGNCGMGAAPYQAVREHFGTFFGDAAMPGWEGYRGYLEVVERAPPSLNVAMLVGHNTIRAAVLGMGHRAPTADEQRAMRELVREGLEAGAVGFSTGLIYEPGRHCATEEVIELVRDVAAAGGVYATHMRNEASGLLDAVREAIRIGRESGVRVQISHHKAAGKRNWGRVRESIGLIEEARAEGLDVTADQYPYTSGSTMLAAVLHNNAFNSQGDRGGIARIEPERVLIASAPLHPEYEGQTIAQLAVRLDLSPEEAARKVDADEQHHAIAILDMMDEGDVQTVMRHPTTMIGSDGIPLGGKPHPRLYGTFARVLGHYARELGLLTMEDAVYRMTGMPAQKFGLADRGVLRAGAYADLVIFDPATVIDTGTFSEPKRYPAGIAHVFVNGVGVVANGRHTNARPGRALRRG
ncbi:MAG TPA: D-aminoacylase [Candidatus Binataceae bacterium]|nr:D-aminoacylase [Candidatus Binataceae bacterium]